MILAIVSTTSCLDKPESSEESKETSKLTSESDNKVINNPNIILHYDMSHENGYLLDVSENENHAKLYNIKDSAFTKEVDDDLLELPGTSDSYAELPLSITDGLDYKSGFSVEIVLIPRTKQYQFLWTFGTGFQTDYLFMNPMTPGGSVNIAIKTAEGNNTENSVSGIGEVNLDTKEFSIVTVTSEGNTIKAYVNGKLIGTLNHNHDLNEIFKGNGSNILGYIAKSNWNDPYCDAILSDFKVYNKTLSELEVKEIYYSSNYTYDTQTVLETISALDLGNITNITQDLVLPTSRVNGAIIEWASSNESILKNNGKVILPKTTQAVTLTATLSIGKINRTKDFTAHITGKNNLKEIVMDKLILPYYLTDKDVLPMSIDGSTISWESDHNAINPVSGIITQPKSGEAEVNLTANVKFDKKNTVQKKFKVKVMGKGTQYILSYTRMTDKTTHEKTGMYNEYVCDSMHLGISADGKTYEPLLNNTGVLFAKAQGADTKLLKQPFIFRMKDGSFGILAIRVNAEESVNDVPGTFILFTSPDLISFNEVGLVKLTDQGQIKNPYCTYDAYRNQYIVSWTDASTGTSYASTTSDFKQFSSPELFSSPRTTPPLSGIQYAIESNVLPINQNESTYIINKLKPVTNTTVDDTKISVSAGQNVNLASIKVKAHYTDGTSTDKAVNWNQDDLAGVDFNKPGTYTVNGTVKQLDDDGTNYPFLKNRADPAIVKYNNKYYFIATTEESGNINLYIRESDTLLGLKTAKENLVFDVAKGASAGYVTKNCHWAPELHIINGELCMLFSANDDNGFNVQSMFMKLTPGGDPKKYDDWGNLQRILDKSGNFLSNNSTYGGITLDMTHFAYNNRHYVVWSQRNFNKNGGTADLWIGEIDADKPWQLISDPVIIVFNEYGWERNHTFVNEGPFVIIKDDKLYMTYSGGGVDETYSVGITTVDLNENVNFLNPGTWVKTNYPILTGFSVPGIDGPGHNSYVTDDDGQLINAYHARIPSKGWSRDTLLRIVHFGADGTPILDMSTEREILPSNKNVKLIVTIK